MEKEILNPVKKIIMRTNFIFLLFLFYFNNAIGQKQEIEPSGPRIPLYEYFNYKLNYIKIPDNAYVKDIDGDLNKFLGTWKGVYNNKNYEFVVVKKSKYFGDMYMDVLEMRYKISDILGNVLINTLDLPSLSPYVIKGSFMSTDKKDYVLRYVGYNSKCGQLGLVTFASITGNPNQMRLGLVPEGMSAICEQTDDVEQVLPVRAGVFLTKQ